MIEEKKEWDKSTTPWSDTISCWWLFMLFSQHKMQVAAEMADVIGARLSGWKLLGVECAIYVTYLL